MSKLHKTSGEDLSGFFSMPDKSFKNHQPELRKDLPSKKSAKSRDWATQKPNTRMSNSSAIDSRGSKFLNSGKGDVSDDRGPKKQLGVHNQNSMWDSGVIDRLAQTKRSDENMSEEKSSREKVKNGFREDRMNELAEGIRNVDTRKAETIENMSAQDGSADRKAYQRPSNHISIFDDSADFSRLPTKTRGEKVAETARKPREKDLSWREVKGTSKNSGAIDSLFQKLTSERGDK
jgi:hypothetical protein